MIKKIKVVKFAERRKLNLKKNKEQSRFDIIYLH